MAIRYGDYNRYKNYNRYNSKAIGHISTGYQIHKRAIIKKQNY